MSTRGRAALGALANVAAVAALAAVASYWGWRWFGPQPLSAERAPIDDVVAALAVSPPFGASAPAAPATGAVPAVAGDPRVLGVLAEPQGRGRALLRLADGTAKLAGVGDALGPGTALAAVHVDGITLRDAGGERRIPLRSAPAARPSAVPAAPRAGACAPAGYRGPVVRLNAELVSGLVAQPQTLTTIVEGRDGALVVRDDTGFAAMLGLRKGDRVTQANGIALRTPEDVIVAVLRPLAASQAVRVAGMRGNAPQELLIVNAGACPS